MVFVNDYVDTDSDYDYDEDDEYAPRVVTDDVDVTVPKEKGKVFKCDKASCRALTFKTAAALRNHKIANKGTHDYCATCDEDFKDFDQLTLHLLNSDKHMTCCVCLKEFKSEGGLQLHMKQSHRQRLDAKCPSCGEPFPTESGLLQHVEGNLCAGGLRRSDLYRQIMETQEAMSNLAVKPGSSKASPPPGTPTAAPAASGSAPLNTSGASNPSPRVRLVDVRDQGEEVQDQQIEILDEWFDVKQRVWVCPFKNCKKRFYNLLPFEQHVNSSTHQAKNFRCPGCMNRFSSSSALLQHVEAGQCRLGTAKANKELYKAVQEELRTGTGNRTRV